MVYYEITTPVKTFVTYDAEKRYGVKFNEGTAYVDEDQMWVTTGGEGPTSTVSTPVWKVFQDEHGYTVRRLEPDEAPIREPATKATRPDRAHD